MDHQKFPRDKFIIYLNSLIEQGYDFNCSISHTIVIAKDLNQSPKITIYGYIHFNMMKYIIKTINKSDLLTIRIAESFKELINIINDELIEIEIPILKSHILK